MIVDLKLFSRPLKLYSYIYIRFNMSGNVSEYTRNGCKKAGRIPKNERHFRSTPKSIATIDFGTTHCSASYVMEVDTVPNPRLLKPTLLSLDDRGNKRVPSCILFDGEGQCSAFGYQARSDYAALSLEERGRYAYFEHVKKRFSTEKNVDRNRKVVASNDKSYFLIEVIAQILCYLKGRILKEIRGFVYPNFMVTDMDWVITVPAIWSARGKKMMREAGYKAGLCDSDITVHKLIPASPFPPALQHVKNPEKLSLALEPESAAIQCLTAYENAGSASLAVTNYMIVDCGGGTVDIATHGFLGGNVVELVPATGNYEGGTAINLEFKSFLGELLGDKNFDKFLDEDEPDKRYQKIAQLDKLVFLAFEEQKMHFGDKWDRESYPIDLPRVFAAHFSSKIVEKCRDRIDVQAVDDGWTIRLSPTCMAKIFEPCIQKIASLIVDHIRDENLLQAIDTIFWVGGFGGCKYLQYQLKKRLEEEFSEKIFQHSTPPEPHLAIINGATAFRLDPAIVQQRRADATYGILCATTFQSGLHKPNYLELDEDYPGKRWCKNVFSCFVERNEPVCTNEVFVSTFHPSTILQSSCTIALYSSPQNDVFYTTDLGVKELAKLELKLGGRGRDREIEIIFDITHTEIQVCARDKQTGEEEKMIADFLSSV